MSDALLCVKSVARTMEVCPCSADVGDCNRCGKKYPPETMSGKPPKDPKVLDYVVPEGHPLYAQLEPIYHRIAQASIDQNKEEFNKAVQEAKAVFRQETATKGIAQTKLTTRKKVFGRGKTRRNKTSGGDIVSHLLTIRNQVKLYHWQTGSFARHTATDNLTTALDTNIDAFVESYMGRYGRPKVSGSIKLHNFSEAAAKAFVAKETKYLASELPRKIGKNDTDLLNLRDTILGDLTKVLYLFTLQ